jgi:uncharacterized hydrophobic protein (TIGR00341 family)
MTLRLVTVAVATDRVPAVIDCAERYGAGGVQVHASDHPAGWARVEMIAGPEGRQELIDALQAALDHGGDWRISLLPVETTIPLPEDEEAERAREEERKATAIGGLTREEIMTQVSEDARIGRDYLIFVALSAVVAAFGMVEGSAAVVIGAMVIAPLLGPMLAFSVGVALGDGALMARAAAAAALGMGVATALGAALGLVLPIDVATPELADRSRVGAGGIAIALASGAAAALSLATGVAGALVGVMVAVALLPPAVAAGLFLGSGRGDLALGAALLLCINVVCVNLAAQVVLTARGITPRTWFEKQRARRGSLINAGIWLALLVALAALLWVRAPTI